MAWSREDLNQYNTAKSPWYHIAPNGKVDIGLELSPESKLGLSKNGMVKLVKDWIEKSNGLTESDKEELITLLKQPNKGFRL